jgi:hypothetical protein
LTNSRPIAEPHKRLSCYNTDMNVLLLALCMLAPQQAGSSPQPPAPTNSLKKALAVQEQIADLSLLQSLAPLKLTAEQANKILPVLKKARERAVELNRQDDEALIQLGPEVAKARTQAITESIVPDTIEKRVGETQRLAASRRLEATRKTVAELQEFLRDVFTPVQKDEIEKQSEKFFGGKRVPKEFAKDPNKAPKNVVQDLALAAYIERVLLFDRTIPLLELIKTAGKPE